MLLLCLPRYAALAMLRHLKVMTIRYAHQAVQSIGRVDGMCLYRVFIGGFKAVSVADLNNVRGASEEDTTIGYIIG